MTQQPVLGVDVGGTKVLVGRVVGSVVESMVELPSRAADPDGVRSVIEGVRRVQEATACAGDKAAVAIGIGVPEYVHRGVVRSAEVLRWASSVGGIADDVALPVVVESDVRCGAYAEAWAGAGKGAANIVYLSWGTGVSSCLVIDGKPYEGGSGEAIAIGEWDVHGEHSLEETASGGGLGRRFDEVTGSQGNTGSDVTRAAIDGDSRAAALLDAAATSMGLAIRRLVDLLDPDCVVIGGGIGSGVPGLVDPAVRAYQQTSRRPDVQVRVAGLGAYSGIIGAGMSAADGLQQ